MLLRISMFLVAALLLPGCASVQDTAQYYVSYTTKIYPPKPKDAPIPILGRKPTERYRVIGRLAFESPHGWKFLRKSMEYNARMNGADAVLLKDESSRTETIVQDVPARMDWEPVSTWVCTYDKKGRSNGGYYVTNYVPVYRPGYTQVSQVNWIAIDAEMLVFKK